MFETKDGRAIDIEKITWDKVRDDLLPLNPHLVKLIDKLGKVTKDFPFYKAKYTFGTAIIKKSKAFLPLSDGQKIYFNDPEIPEQLVQDLGYDPVTSQPLGVILSKNCEFYMPVNDRIIPHAIISPGAVFGVGRILNNLLHDGSTGFPQKPASALWDFNAGAKSVFMLAKISDNNGHNKLNKFLGSDIEKPLSYQEHTSTFRRIAKNRESDWACEILYFSNKWLAQLKEPIFVEFVNYLFQVNRASNKVWHNTPKWTTILNDIDSKKRLDHHSFYVLATARHLLGIAAGLAPGFRPAVDDSSAPVSTMQKAYIEGYELTEHWPSIMEAAEFVTSDNQPIYYSLNHPTLPQYNPNTYKGKSIIALEEDVRHVMETYCSAITEDERTKIESSSLYSAATTVDFSFYHNDPASYKNIKNSLSLPEDDPRFKCMHAPDATFPNSSAFFKGCVMIKPKAI